MGDNEKVMELYRQLLGKRIKRIEEAPNGRGEPIAINIHVEDGSFISVSPEASGGYESFLNIEVIISAD